MRMPSIRLCLLGPFLGLGKGSGGRVCSSSSSCVVGWGIGGWNVGIDASAFIASFFASMQDDQLRRHNRLTTPRRSYNSLDNHNRGPLALSAPTLTSSLDTTFYKFRTPSIDRLRRFFFLGNLHC